MTNTNNNNIKFKEFSFDNSHVDMSKFKKIQLLGRGN